MILDKDGKPAGEEDIQWAVEMIFRWLEDQPIREVLVEHGVYKPAEIQRLGGLLHAALVHGTHVKPDGLRTNLVRILGDRVVRVKIAARVLKNEAESRRAYEEICAIFPQIMAEWARRQMDGHIEERPTLPDAEPPARTRHAVMTELLALRDDLQARAESESLIVRPT